jgi:uncharacterized protein
VELTHRFTVPAPVEAAWATFTDLESVGSCFPGATVTSATDEEFAGTVKVKLGPIALVYSGTGSFLERDDAAHRAVLQAKGKDKRGNGTAGATVRIRLEPQGAGTVVDVTTDLSVTGKPAQFGRGVMQDVSDKLLQQFVACIESRFVESAETSSAPDHRSTPRPARGGPPSGPVPSVAHRDVQPPTAPLDGPVRPDGPDGPASAVRPAPGPAAARASSADAVDLGATVLPVLARTYGPYVAVGVVAFVLGWLLGRR